MQGREMKGKKKEFCKRKGKGRANRGERKRDKGRKGEDIRPEIKDEPR